MNITRVKKQFLAVTLMIVIFIISVCYNIYKYEFKNIALVNKYTNMNVYVVKKDKIDDEKIVYIVKYKSCKFILNIYIKDQDDINRYSNFLVGDILNINAKISNIEKLNNPYEFDYKRYLNSNGISGILVANKLKKINNSITILDGFIEDVKFNVNEKINDIFDNKKIGLYNSIVYGDKNSLDTDINNKFRELGISHLISVSGTNIHILILVLSFFLENINGKIKNTILLIYIVMFMMISGMGPAVFRAGIMAVLLIFLNNKNVYKRLFISLYIQIVVNPYVIFNSSFILSYTAILSIILFNSLIFSYLDTRLRSILGVKYKFGNKKMLYNMLKYITSLFSLTLSVYVLLMPLQIVFFSSFNFFSFISNIVISIPILIQQIIGTILLFFPDLFIISDILIYANYFVLNILENLIDFLYSIKFPVFKIADLGWITHFIYYFIIIYYKFRPKIDHYIIKKYKNIGTIILNKVWIGTIFYVLYIIIIYVYIVFFESYVIFFNVGQGNCALIKYRKDVVIVDVGSDRKGVAANVLNTFLKKKAISSIDAVFLTHMHDDHINGFKGVVENVKVDKICYFEFENETDFEIIKINDICREEKIEEIKIKQRGKIDIGNINVDILSPINKEYIEDDDMKNANSLVILINAGNSNYLFMGDATKKSEEKIFCDNKIDEKLTKKLNKIDALQVGHHGSNTSTSNYLLDNIVVKEAVISAKKEKFGHPNEEVLSILKKYNIRIRITQKEGAVKLNIK